MCYNKETSLQTFSITLICSIILIFRNLTYDRVLAIFFIVVSLVQLLEYFIWSDQECGEINNIATRLLLVTISIQPIVLLIGCIYYNLVNLNHQIIYIYLGIYSIIICIIAFNAFTIKKKLCSKPSEESHHLLWDIQPILYTIPNSIYLFIILYFVILLVFLFFKNKSLAVIYFILYCFSFILSIVLNYSKKGTWKTYWCWIGNIVPILSLIIGYLYDI